VKDHRAYAHVLLFSLTKLLNMAMVRNFEVMLGQTLNHSVWIL